MKFTTVAFLLVLVSVCRAAVEEEEKREHVERQRPRHEEKKQRVSEEEKKKESPLKLDERTKEILLEEKSKTHVFMEKLREFFLSNQNRVFERQCFEKFNPGESVDFVIDLAPSPSLDKVDKSLAESPIALYLDVMGYYQQRTPSRSYFNAIARFIDFVTFDMKPEATYSIIYDKQRYFIHGKSIDVSQVSKGDFSDSMRNLKTMWPSPTKSIPSESLLHPVLKNNLGKMTKLALWNRDNGLPTVLSGSRRSKPVYTIVITDGASGAKINDLIGEEGELSRTTVIDIGNRRFVKSLDWNDMRRLVSVVTLSAPQQLAAMITTCRMMACRLCGC